MFIQTESTPNPDSLKFLVGRDVMGGRGAVDFATCEEANVSPLAGRLFALDAVERVFLGSDFVTVTKSTSQSAGDWQHLKPAVLGALMEHFVSGDLVMAETASSNQEDAAGAYEGEEAEIVEQIVALLDERVRPAVAQDGGDITFHRYDKGVVFLHMRGACAGCPSASFTLQSGVENLLKHYIPEVTHVVQVEETQNA